jgi:hypothetical protein
MSTTVERLEQTTATSVADGLRRFAVLPDWLSAIAQPERVRRSLLAAIPEFAGGALTLLDCEVRRLRIKDDYWTTLYNLTVAGPEPEEPRRVAVRGTLLRLDAPAPEWAPGEIPFGAEGWRGYLPDLRLALEMQPPDAALPALPYLTDPQEARALLETSIRAHAPGYADLQIAACTPRVMRYKPGSRCTILYNLEYPADLAAARRWPEIVVAKTYRGDKGQTAYVGMRALWESPLAADGRVTIAEPLAFLPEENVLVQGPIREEQTLKELLRAALRAGTPEALDELHLSMRKTAAGLAALHGSGVQATASWTWEDELAEVEEDVDRLAAAIPALDGAATPLLARLRALNAAHPPDPAVPSHGTFRPAQVLIYQGQIGFIDFDGFCQAEPALDVALFLSKIWDIGLSVAKSDESEEDDDFMDPQVRAARFAQVEKVGETFLTAYAAHAPVSPERVALWQALALFTIMLHGWTKVKPMRLVTTMFLLERHLEATDLISVH